MVRRCDTRDSLRSLLSRVIQTAVLFQLYWRCMVPRLRPISSLLHSTLCLGSGQCTASAKILGTRLLRCSSVQLRRRLCYGCKPGRYHNSSHDARRWYDRHFESTYDYIPSHCGCQRKARYGRSLRSDGSPSNTRCVLYLFLSKQTY